MKTSRRRHAAARGDGFTLLEVLLVLAILGVLAAMVVPMLVGRQRESLKDATRLTLHNVKAGLDAYAIDHLGEYPTTSEGLQVLLAATSNDRYWKGPYLDKFPRDAWDQPFQYQYPGQHKKGGFDLSSPGPDKTPETEDDITNWQDQTR